MRGGGSGVGRYIVVRKGVVYVCCKLNGEDSARSAEEGHTSVAYIFQYIPDGLPSISLVHPPIVLYNRVTHYARMYWWSTTRERVPGIMGGCRMGCILEYFRHPLIRFFLHPATQLRSPPFTPATTAPHPVILVPLSHYTYTAPAPRPAPHLLAQLRPERTSHFVSLRQALHMPRCPLPHPEAYCPTPHNSEHSLQTGSPVPPRQAPGFVLYFITPQVEAMLQETHVESAFVEPVQGPTSRSPTAQMAFVHDLHALLVGSLYSPGQHVVPEEHEVTPGFVRATHPAALT